MDAYQFAHRSAGVLLHPTSLPSGTLEDAYRWIDFLAQAGLSIWQILPLGVPQTGLSPYQCISAFAINPALVKQIESPTDKDLSSADFLHYCQQQKHWLDDYALFVVIKSTLQTAIWTDWPEPLRSRDPAAMQDIRQANASELNHIHWQQFQLYRRWQDIRQYARVKNIYLFGDMPIFVAHDSADVWACQDRFLLDDAGDPIQVAGVPPDYFSETGQRWGNPHYDWEYMQHENFRWWLDRLHNHFDLFDLVRIDHFRGLEAVWMIYAEAETAVEGFWQKVPGDALLSTLQTEMKDIPLVAEDLGVITPEVVALKEKFHLPGMSILQFSFDWFDDNPHKPQNIQENTVVYTGTHDNDTALGWYHSLTEDEKQHVLQTLEIDSEHDVVDRLIQTAFATKASLAIIPLQDFLHLDSEARMNIPGTIDDNWTWQFKWEQLEHPQLTQRIHQWLETTHRLS